MIGAGKLDRRIVIERETTSPNAFNEPAGGWSTLLTLWARRQDTSDVTKTEVLGADQIGAFRLSYFTIRSSVAAKGIMPKDRIAHDGRIWNIKGIKETQEGRNRYLQLAAVTGID